MAERGNSSLFSDLSESRRYGGEDHQEIVEQIAAEDTNDSKPYVAAEEKDTGTKVAPIVKLKAVVVSTGEENEEELINLRVKLYRFDKERQEWKERGVGSAKLLKNKETENVRFVMRQSKTLKICANHAVSLSMRLKEHGSSHKARVWNATDFADGELKDELFCVRFGSVEDVQAFEERFEDAQKAMLLSGSVTEDTTATTTAATTATTTATTTTTTTTTLGQELKDELRIGSVEQCFEETQKTMLLSRSDAEDTTATASLGQELKDELRIGSVEESCEDAQKAMVLSSRSDAEDTTSTATASLEQELKDELRIGSVEESFEDAMKAMVLSSRSDAEDAAATSSLGQELFGSLKVLDHKGKQV